jgi:transcriptional regulator with XRE-family HTH domain
VTGQSESSRAAPDDTPTRLAYWLKKLDMNQATLAKTSGLGPSRISKYMAGAESPGQLSLIALCRGLGISRQAFFAPMDAG